MGMKDRLGRVAQRAKEVGDQVKAEAAGARDDARTAAQARIDSAKEAVAQKADAAQRRAASATDSVTSKFDDIDLEALLARVPVPASPVAQPWRFSLSKIITSGERPPKGTGLLLKQLDRLGAIDIGPEEVGFEDTTAKWPKAKVFRTRTPEGMIAEFLGEFASDGLSNLLPPVPGRGWVVEKATSVMFTLMALVSEAALRDPEVAERQFVCEIEYKGWIRTKETATGFFTGPAMVLVPGLNDLFLTEAARHGVNVEAAPSTALESAERRAARLREKQQTILARRERARAEIED